MRPLDGNHTTRPGSHAYGRIYGPNGEVLIVESVQDCTGSYLFTCCETGRSIEIRADGTWQWEFMPRDKLLKETGLDFGGYSEGGFGWKGYWQTKIVRNPVMRAVQAAAVQLDVACSTTEIQALILTEPLGRYDTNRHGSTGEFASKVANRVDHDGLTVVEAIAAQFEANVRLALRVPAMACSFTGADDWHSWQSRGGRAAIDLWNGRSSIVVYLSRLRAAANVPELESCAEEAVHKTRLLIADERRNALADQRDGQLALL